MKNWDDLRYYLAVARRGTVSAAARELDVSHATVLRRIDQLETDLGVKLFQRLQTGYRLSEAGEVLYDAAAEIEAGLRTLQARVQGRDDELAGTIRVAQTENVVVDLYPLYAQFSARYPEIKLEVLLSPSIVNLNKLEADVAIRQTETPDDLLVGRRVGRVRFGAYAAATYLQRFEQAPAIADLDWVLWDRKVCNWALEDSCFHQLYQQVSRPRVVMETASYTEIVAAIRAGMGAGFLSDEIVRQHDDLLPIPGCRITTATSLWVLTHRDLRNVRRIVCFMRFISEQLMALLGQDRSGTG